MTKILIDCTKQPKDLEGFTIESHDISLGKINPNFELYVDDKQKSYIQGYKLRENLKNKPVLNATVLDYLLEHTELIPESWKDKYVYFWGTIYRGSGGSLFVRYLCFDDGSWDRSYCWLDYGFRSNGPAALLASSSKTLKPSDSSDLSDFELRLLALEDFKRKIEKIINYD